MNDTSEKSPTWADRGWWVAVEYGVVTKQDRFEKKLQKLRTLGRMKELLEPGGKIVYRNLFRETQVKDAWTLLCELAPWKAQLRCFMNGEEVPVKEASDILWCAGFLRADRPCRGVLPDTRGEKQKAHAWAVGCDRRLSVAPSAFDETSETRRHVFTFARVDERGMLVFDREAMTAWLATGTVNQRCPISPARDPAALAGIFQDVSVRALGWPVVLDMNRDLVKKLGSKVLEAEHGFVLKKGVKELEEYAPIELRRVGEGVLVRRADDPRGGDIARAVRVPARVEKLLAEDVRLRGVRIEEGYIKLPELGERYEIEQRFVLATRFHLGMGGDPRDYAGYTVGTVPRPCPEYEQWARAVVESVQALAVAPGLAHAPSAD